MDIGFIKAGFILAVSALFLVVSFTLKHLNNIFSSGKSGKNRQ